MMLSAPLPSPSHFSPSESGMIPYSSALTFESEAEVPKLLRFCYTGEVDARGADVLAYCTTLTAPGLPHMARRVRKMTLDFGTVRPAPAALELVADALAAVTNLEELALFGMPSRENDGRVLRNASFKLHTFSTNLSLTSKDVLDFLSRQQGLTRIRTISPPATEVPQRNAYQHMPFPHSVVPLLRALDCPAPFLMSLLAASPPTRPLTSLRVDLNRMNPLVESEALRALSTFSSTVKRLSLCRSVPRASPASDSSGAMTMSSVMNCLAAKRKWSKLQFLEMRDGVYDSVSASFSSAIITRLN